MRVCPQGRLWKGIIFFVMTLNIALLILRVAVGLTLAAHGAQKLFGWFGGPGLTRLQQGFTAQGFRPAWLWVALVTLGEVGGGLSLAFGFLTPLGAAGAFGAMFMAAFKNHWKKGYFNSKGGLEYPFILMVVAIALGVSGAGSFSLDALLFGRALPEAALFLALAAAALVVDAVGMLITRPRTPAVAQRAETPVRAS